MGVWLPSVESRQIAREHEGLRGEYTRALSDWTESDVDGSPFAICGYDVDPRWGGNAALAEFRARLVKRGIRLILDFIPNHTACDHPWVSRHPEWFVQGTESDAALAAASYFWVQTDSGPVAIAHGRDPNFPSWTDTAQLNYAHPEVPVYMRAQLTRLAELCDGVRCDMAMLELSTVYEQVWKRRIEEFWPQAIEETKKKNPDFCFIAEVYWGLDGALRDLGFDVTYDKDLLDEMAASRVLGRDLFALPITEHRRRLRFLENHDEPRAATRWPSDQQQAAAVWAFSLPSARLIFDGQIEGKRVRLPIQLLREPDESVHDEQRARYRKLLAILKRDTVRSGEWQLLTPGPAWTGNESHQRILGQAYDTVREHLRVFVNWSDARSQCWVRVNLGPLVGKDVELHDLLGTKVYVRNGMELMTRGLYLDMQPWEAQIFECTVHAAGSL